MGDAARLADIRVRSRRARLGAARDGQLLRHARHPGGLRPHLRARRRPHAQHASCRRPQSSALARAIERRRVDRRPDPEVERPAVHRDRHRARADGAGRSAVRAGRVGADRDDGTCHAGAGEQARLADPEVVARRGTPAIRRDDRSGTGGADRNRERPGRRASGRESQHDPHAPTRARGALADAGDHRAIELGAVRPRRAGAADGLRQSREPPARSRVRAGERDERAGLAWRGTRPSDTTTADRARPSRDRRWRRRRGARAVPYDAPVDDLPAARTAHDADRHERADTSARLRERLHRADRNPVRPPAGAARVPREPHVRAERRGGLRRACLQRSGGPRAVRCTKHSSSRNWRSA